MIYETKGTNIFYCSYYQLNISIHLIQKPSIEQSIEMKPEEQPKICVVIRKRPLNKKEQQRNESDIISVQNGQTLIVSEYKQKVDLTKYIEESVFNFDHVFDETSQNQQIYAKAVRPLVQSAFEGAKVTCFAYGQTGSGKTFTMNGDPTGGVSGLYTLGAQDIFTLLAQSQQSLKVYVSFFEIYCGKLFDLLNNRNELKLREDNKQNVHIVGLQESELFTPEEFMKVIEYGGTYRVTSQNSTNADSSRSHAILQISLKEGKKVFGKISFIDLAGCERGADHMDQNKQTRIDGAEINKSLLALKECIRALDQGKGHTPFRGSKLTMVLKDSFIGFCKTVMIGNVSPGLLSCENTLNTLRYADRVKELKKSSDKEQMSKQDQLAKELMLPRMNKNAVKIHIENGDDMEDIQLKKIEAHKKILGIKNSDKDSHLSFAQHQQINTARGPQYTFGGVQQTWSTKHEDKRSESLTSRNPVTNSIGSIKLRNVQGSPKAVNSSKATTPSTSGFHSKSPGKTNNFSKTFLTKQSAPQLLKIVEERTPTLPNSHQYKLNQPLQRTQSTSKSNFASFNTSVTDQNYYHLNNNFVASLQKPVQPTMQNLDWSKTVESIRQWHPQSKDQMMNFKNIHQQMINKLVKQQDQIISEHSIVINREIDIIKTEMKLISEIEQDKGRLEPIQYAEYLSDMIDEKLRFLMGLKKKVDGFKEKILEQQECEEKMFMVKDHFAQEQLLDD